MCSSNVFCTSKASKLSSKYELEAALARSNVFCTSKASNLSSKYAQRTQTELEAALARSNVERESEELQAYIYQ